MADKPKIPSPEQKIPSLTALAEQNKDLSDLLAYHTRARNYLANILTQPSVPGVQPILILQPPVEAKQAGDESIAFNVSKLPGDVVEMLLMVLLEHEERAAFDVWNDLQVVSKQAVDTVERMMSQRQAEMQKQRQEAAQPPTLKFPGPKMPPTPLQPPTAEENDTGYLGQEVPTGWPGRTDDEG